MSRVVKLSKATQIGSSVFPANAQVVVDDAVADDMVKLGKGSEAGHGNAKILSGTNSVKVTHGLGTTPSGVFVTGTHSEVSSCIVTAADASSATIQTGGGANTSADRTVYWFVRP